MLNSRVNIQVVALLIAVLLVGDKSKLMASETE